MELTFIGYAQIVLGMLVVIAGNMRHALMLLMASALFNGSAAILLPALGGSSIPPIQFALAFVFLRILMPGSAAIGDLPEALKANRMLALFSFYGIATAFILPRIFAGSVNVYPMQFNDVADLFATVPLEPTSQNLTAAFYLLGSLLSAIVVWIACRRTDAAATMVGTLIVMAWVHSILGLAGIAIRGTSVDAVFELFRNSAYVQMDDAIGGFVRIRGIFPESSAYATLGFVLFVANSEMWYRSIRSTATGLATLVMGTVLFFSTSSTAYLGLAIYGLFFALRIFALPGATNFAKAKTAFAAIGSIIFLSALLFIASPALVEGVVDVVKRMTIEKSSSDSGMQRLYWAQQGWDLFRHSYGLGVGPGSFRSSSIFFAMLGSMGVIGILSFLSYLIAAFQPWRRSSWTESAIPAENLGGALGSAALLSLIPAAVNSPTAVPGVTFVILASASLALRPFDLARRIDPFRRAETPVSATTVAQ
ncbi:glycoside hydrolase [Sphingorhabdus pulchriflava]|uniref:Glycoside hydrolase n=1 Tax=Sphingorhabdus pulchriflava TaxID=2292257 RepID=A0A371BI76_9SPHN|nr:O-antigen ligase family protein [Sphingorhabdus pulchriflava]RDV07238.1 glycoside hydrolase [Sphingorhabdus pulchriflava]